MNKGGWRGDRGGWRESSGPLPGKPICPDESHDRELILFFTTLKYGRKTPKTDAFEGGGW